VAPVAALLSSGPLLVPPAGLGLPPACAVPLLIRVPLAAPLASSLLLLLWRLPAPILRRPYVVAVLHRPGRRLLVLLPSRRHRRVVPRVGRPVLLVAASVAPVAALLSSGPLLVPPAGLGLPPACAVPLLIRVPLAAPVASSLLTTPTVLVRLHLTLKLATAALAGVVGGANNGLRSRRLLEEMRRIPP